MTTLQSLAARCEEGAGADRELDLAIHLALWPDGNVARVIARATRGFDGCSRFAWELREHAVLYEQRNDRGDCYSNGGYPVLPFTASLDAAMGLVPEGWDHLEVYRPDHQTLGWTVHICPAQGPRIVQGEGFAQSYPLAICAAALRARAAGEVG